MKIGIITTLDTNIGDDLVREGILLLLKSVFRERKIELVLLNKHRPLTVYEYPHPLRFADNLVQLLPRGRYTVERALERMFHRFGKTRFDACDLIIQSGAPVLWNGLQHVNWATPIWHHVIGRLHKRIPVLNLAAGSCYPWESQPESLTNPGEKRFVESMLGYCRLTTARDRLAQKLLSSLGGAVVLLPCTAFLSGVGKTINGKSRRFVMINYMTGGGHYDYGQNIDTEKWRNDVMEIVRRLSRRHDIAILSHNQHEYNVAKALFPGLVHFFPKSPAEYFSAITEAKAAICNRLHACVAMASVGIPSIGVGTDTRLLMLETIGLHYVYVKDLNVQWLIDTLEVLISNVSQEQERLFSLRSKTWTQYSELMSTVIND